MAARKLVERDGDGDLVAVVDLLIDRPDLGPGAATLVAAGDQVPPALADHERRPR